MDKKHVIFDFDGVLGDTYDMNFAIKNQIFDNTITKQMFDDHHSSNPHSGKVIVWTEETRNGFFKKYNEELSIEHVVHSMDFLNSIKDDYTLHITTSSSEAGITRVFDELEIGDKFTNILGFETHASKVEKFKMLEQEYSDIKSAALFVTDSLGDLHEASEFGIASVAVSFGYHDVPTLEQGESVAITHSFDELKNEIERFFTYK